MENPFEGPSEPITLEMITKTINKMASGKAAGHSGIVAETKKPLGEAGVAEVLDFIDTTAACSGGPKMSGSVQKVIGSVLFAL